MLCGTIECLLYGSVGYEHEHEHEMRTIDEMRMSLSFRGMAWH
jgi:hypothetical protein